MESGDGQVSFVGVEVVGAQGLANPAGVKLEQIQNFGFD
jgi:hypothetical protein